MIVTHLCPRMDAVHLLYSTSNRFSLRQRAVLTSYYRLGMVGTRKLYSIRHERAAAEVGYTVDKVKVCMQNWLYDVYNGVFTISEMDKETKSPRETHKTQKLCSSL